MEYFLVSCVFILFLFKKIKELEKKLEYYAKRSENRTEIAFKLIYAEDGDNFQKDIYQILFGLATKSEIKVIEGDLVGIWEQIDSLSGEWQMLHKLPIRNGECYKAILMKKV